MTTTDYTLDTFKDDLYDFAKTFVDDMCINICENADELFEHEALRIMLANRAQNAREYEKCRKRFVSAMVKGDDKTEIESAKLFMEGAKTKFESYQRVLYDLLCK